MRENLYTYMLPLVQTITSEIADQFIKGVQELTRHDHETLLASTHLMQEYLSELSSTLEGDELHDLGNEDFQNIAKVFWNEDLRRYFLNVKRGMKVLQVEYEMGSLTLPELVKRRITLDELVDEYFPPDSP